MGLYYELGKYFGVCYRRLWHVLLELVMQAVQGDMSLDTLRSLRNKAKLVV